MLTHTHKKKTQNFTRIFSLFSSGCFIGQITCLCFYFTQQHKNRPTSFTTISTKCLLQKEPLSDCWDSVLGYSSAENLESKIRKRDVYTNGEET